MYKMLRNWSLVFVFPCAALVFFNIDLTYWFEHYPGRVPCLFCLFCIKNSDWKIILRGIHKHSSNQYSLLCQFLKFCLTMSSLRLVCSKPVEIILYLFIDILLCFCIGFMVKAWSGIFCNDYCTENVKVIVHSILLKDVGVQFCEESVPLQMLQGCKSYPPCLHACLQKDPSFVRVLKVFPEPLLKDTEALRCLLLYNSILLFFLLCSSTIVSP